MSELKKVEIFTDGACSGNPGPGGWGAVLRGREAQGALRYKNIHRLAVCCERVFKRLDMELEEERVEKIRQEACFESRAMGAAAQGAFKARI